MSESVVVDADGRDVRISSPGRVYFPRTGLTKLELVEYHLAVSEALLPHCVDRPCNLERYPQGVDGPSFVQKRIPGELPDWLGTVEVTFGSGGRARELCPRSVADVVWSVNLGAITVHPWSVRVDRGGTGPARAEEPDELRIDLDPMPGVAWEEVRRVAGVVREVLEEHGITGFPKTSGSTGMHVVVRIRPLPYPQVRAAAVALAREVERRCPEHATSSWWREQRGARVFLDYNQNLWDRTTACAYAVRATPDARVSLPFTWRELDDVEPRDATVASVPGLIAGRGDPIAALDDTVCDLEGLLDLARRDAEAGLGDLPLPPHYPRFPGEPVRVPPSRAAGASG